MINGDNITTRIDPKFKEDLNKIKHTRLDKGLDKKKLSDRAITKLITRLNYWKKIMEEIMEIKNEEFE